MSSNAKEKLVRAGRERFWPMGIDEATAALAKLPRVKVSNAELKTILGVDNLFDAKRLLRFAKERAEIKAVFEVAV